MMRGIAVETTVWSSALSSTTTASAASVSRFPAGETVISVKQSTGRYCFLLPVHLPSPNEPNTTVPLIVSPVTVPE